MTDDEPPALRLVPPAAPEPASPSTEVVDAALANDREAAVDRFRYRRQDLLAQLPFAVAMVGWGFAAVAVMFYDNGQPRQRGLGRFFNLYSHAEGRASIGVAVWLLLAALLCSGAGLAINSRRMKRRGDRYSRALLLLLALSLLTLLRFVLR